MIDDQRLSIITHHSAFIISAAMVCPICKRPLPEPADRQPHFPFCTERCKLVDLGRWLDGRYQIPVTPPADEDERD